MLQCDGRKCAFRQYIDSGHKTSCCAYSLITGHLRGCPAGKNCIHRTDKLPRGYSQIERSNRLLQGLPI